ncbi:MAG: gliding motility-associated ABC transporter permease subunit GldF [Bacteroidota bacterium]|nr:gliding motility-associated ABC transporter permease subunit GldF [Bacteroidota bacterium]
MLTLFKKELSEFFSTLTGYIVIIIFTVLNGLFLFVFPGGYNLLDNHLANLDSLFFMAPWIFLFLIPAVTMRLFADEKKSGTIELLFSRPISRMNIIFAKYLASVSIVLLSLLPTLIYFASITVLSSQGSYPDNGAIWGSYIGLFLLASVYAAVGIFSSSLTQNQVVAFLLAVILSFLLYIGPDTVSGFDLWGNHGNLIKLAGIDSHYKSISRGVLDSKDLIYFLTASFIFLLSTEYVLNKKK